MNKLSDQKELQSSGLKQITDEEINECMQFCTMYNILHAIHNFKIQLKNVDEKRKVKTKTKPKEEPVKGSSQVNKNKQGSKKVSKFQKPKTSKKKQIQKPILNQQPQSDVDNYNYQQQTFATSRIYEQPLQSSRKNNGDQIYHKNSHHQSPKQQNDLSQLISNLTVSNHQNTLNKKSKQKQDSSFSAFYMNSVHQQPQSSAYQKSQYEPKYLVSNKPENQHISGYQNNNINKNSYPSPLDNGYSQNYSSYQPIAYNNYSNNYDANNPYSKASYQGINYDPNHFTQYPMNKSPSQYTNFTSSPYVSQFDAKSNYSQINKNIQNSHISKNLFHQQSSPLFNTNYLNDNNPYYPKNYIQPQQTKFNKSNQNVRPIQHNHQKNISKNYSQHQATHYNYIQSKTQNHQNQAQYPSNQQQYYNKIKKNQNTPTKIQTSLINNRSPSPLGASNSCRNFFMHSPRDLSGDDKSQTSRSKSRRKQRPGGSKSFYQPSLSGRKIVSKQKQPQIPPQYITNTQYYEPQDQNYSTNRNDEYEAPYFKQQHQQQIVSIHQKKYPNRMTRETEISAVSAWQQRSHPQKSIKSQQVIVSQQYQKKQSEKINQINKKSYQGNENKKNKKVKESSSEHSSQQSSEVQLDNIEAQMEQLSNSRKKIPVPIKIDMTKKDTALRKEKR